jgi:hypothetical protein
MDARDFVDVDPEEIEGEGTADGFQRAEGGAPAPTDRPLGFILDEEDEKKVAKHVTQLREDQADARSRRRAVWQRNKWWREGRRWVRLEKKQDENKWRAYLPAGMGNAPPVPNKTDRLCRRLVNTINVDKPYPECEPAGDDAEDKDAAQFATEYLAVKGASSELNMNGELRAAMDKAMTYGSCFGWVTMDPHAGGHRPRKIIAHPDAESAEYALVDPSTGEEAPEDALIERYQKTDGTLTDDPTEADLQWMPSPKIRRLTGLQLDFLPATAKGIADAIGVVITDTTTLGDLRAQFPEEIEALTEEELVALCSWRPSEVKDVLPAFTKEPEDQKYEDGPQSGQYKPSQMIITTTVYYESCSEYPLGCYAVIGGDTLVLHRQKWTAMMPQPRAENGDERPPVEECLEIPVAQDRCLDDNVNDDPYGIALAENLGPSDEIRASAFAHEIDNMWQAQNPHLLVPVGSIVPLDAYKNRTGTPIFVNPQGKPEWEQVPPLSPTVPNLRAEMTAEMDDESGLQQAAQGVEDPSVKSGIHAQTIVQEALKAVSNIKDNAGDYYIGLNRIILQLTRAYCTVPQLMRWKGKSGEFKAKEFSRTDFRNTRNVTIARGSFTMHTLLAKQEAANNMVDRKVIDAEEYIELMSGNVGPVLATQENPHYLRVRRQLDLWLDGPPDGWVEAYQAYSQGQQMLQQFQQQMPQLQMEQQQLQASGIPVPPPVPPQVPPKPPSPFDPRLPIDDEPMAAKIRHRQIAREMAGTKFPAMPVEWQQALTEVYVLEKNGAGIMTVAEVQQQKAAEQQQQMQMVQQQQQAQQAIEQGKLQLEQEKAGADVQLRQADLQLKAQGAQKEMPQSPQAMETIHERDDLGRIIRSFSRPIVQ